MHANIEEEGGGKANEAFESTSTTELDYSSRTANCKLQRCEFLSLTVFRVMRKSWLTHSMGTLTKGPSVSMIATRSEATLLFGCIE